MAYNHGREDRKWRIWKEAEEKLLRECGVDEATIEQIRMSEKVTSFALCLRSSLWVSQASLCNTVLQNF